MANPRTEATTTTPVAPTPDKGTEPTCCDPKEKEACCAETEKVECCGPTRPAGSCGCR